MSQINYYFPKLSYEQELEERLLHLHCTNVTGLDTTTGIKHSVIMGCDMYTHEDVPNDFDMSKYEIVYSETINDINNVNDFDMYVNTLAERKQKSHITNSSQFARREFGNGDIIEINGLKYYCLTFGWKQVQ